MKEDLDASAMIAKELGESGFEACRQITEIVEVLGQSEAFALLDRVIDIEDEGGWRVPDGSRRRTPGGIFFRLAREKLPREATQRIFFGKGRGGSTPKAATPSAAEDRSAARPRRRIVEVEPSRRPSKPAAKSEFPKLVTDVDSVRARIEKALIGLSLEEQRGLLVEFIDQLPRAVVSEAPPSAATRPPTSGTKSAFVLSLPLDMPAKGVLERAKAEGITLSASQVYNIRSSARRRSG
jgi:hypothetical protein